jgi:predicted DNA-binding protein with PD1-like motif
LLKKFTVKEVYVGLLPRGGDFLDELEKFAREKDIQAAEVQLIGFADGAVFGYYDSENERYIEMRLGGKLEVISAIGNISMKDGKPFAHIHIVLGDEKKQLYGGHLLPGTKIIVAETRIAVLTGDELVREHEPETGLFLWK